MQSITLRNFPPELGKTIRLRARRKRVSVNKAVIGLLEEHLTSGVQKEAALYHDLDDLCGSWSEDAADAFDEVLAKQRSIDPDVWK